MKEIYLPSGDICVDEDWGKLKEYFQLDVEPYDLQKVLIVLLVKGFEKYDNILLQAPTGWGKSAIAKAITNYFDKNKGNSYLLTPFINLQGQYRRDFPDLKELKGKKNFVCALNRDVTVDKGPCSIEGFKCDYKHKCGYYEQKEDVDEARQVITNPAFIFYNVWLEKFGMRYLAVYDEAHDLESIMFDCLDGEIELDRYDINYLGEDKEEWKKIIEKHYEQYYNEVMKHRERIEALTAMSYETMTKSQKKELTFLGEIIKDFKLFDAITKIINTEVLISNDKKIAKFEVLRVGDFGKEMLELISVKRLFMSATICGPDLFVRNIGIESEKNLYIEITESPFPIKNRRIWSSRTAYLDYRRYEKGIVKVVNRCKLLLEKYNDVRGVIVCNSHRIRNNIVDGLSKDFEKRIHTHGSGNPSIGCTDCGTFNFSETPISICRVCKNVYLNRKRDSIIGNFFLDESGVYIGTYMSEGVDLKNDLCRLLILPKVPYPPMYGRILERCRLEQADFIRRNECNYKIGKNGLCSKRDCDYKQKCLDWYYRLVIVVIVQNSGRAVRNKTDYCKIEMLDSGFPSFYGKKLKNFPKWFRQAVMT